MEKANETLIIIDPKHIHPHPKNPRKDVGDISELIESVKKNGIMQNLTVIPIEDRPGEYMALIGHRRCAAAVEAELQGVPCRIITGLSEKEQVGIMLEENMQRNDLTPYEQGQGFQMMLDLGSTADEIAEKTGFSRTTIYHRLNIAKLNQKELQKKEKDENFQLSITDLYELEKVKSVKTRNEILKNAADSRTLAQRARNAARDEKRDENEKAVIKELKKLGAEPAPANTNCWDSKWERVKDFDLDKTPKSIKLQGKGPFYYLRSYGTMYILKKAEKEKKKKTAGELLQEKRNKNKKAINAIVKNMDKRRRQFILDIISGTIEPVKEENEIKDAIWKSLLEYGTGVYRSTIFKFCIKKEFYSCTPEEKEETDKWVDSLSVLHQMLVVLCAIMDGIEPFDYLSVFDVKRTEKFVKAQKVLEKYGWFNTDEEQQLLDGTHELYEKREEKKS